MRPFNTLYCPDPSDNLYVEAIRSHVLIWILFQVLISIWLTTAQFKESISTLGRYQSIAPFLNRTYFVLTPSPPCCLTSSDLHTTLLHLDQPALWALVGPPVKHSVHHLNFQIPYLPPNRQGRPLLPFIHLCNFMQTCQTRELTYLYLFASWTALWETGKDWVSTQ